MAQEGSHEGHEGFTMGIGQTVFPARIVSPKTGKRYPFGAMPFAHPEPAIEKRTPLEISKIILDAAFKIHTFLGPGLLESAYEACLEQELNNRGLLVRKQVPLPVVYEGKKLEAGYRIDLLIENCVIVEVKSIEAIAPIHQAQTLSYLRLSGNSLALLINFNVVHLKDGIRRFVMGDTWK